MSSERLMAQLDGARLARYDANGYLLVWFGGHGVCVYEASGREVDYFTVGDFRENNASLEDVEESMVQWSKDTGDDS